MEMSSVWAKDQLLGCNTGLRRELSWVSFTCTGCVCVLLFAIPDPLPPHSNSGSGDNFLLTPGTLPHCSYLCRQG